MTDFYQLLKTFSANVADVLAHEDCPPWLADQLTQLITEASNQAMSLDAGETWSIQARQALPGYLNVVSTLAGPDRQAS